MEKFFLSKNFGIFSKLCPCLQSSESCTFLYVATTKLRQTIRLQVVVGGSVDGMTDWWLQIAVVDMRHHAVWTMLRAGGQWRPDRGWSR